MSESSVFSPRRIRLLLLSSGALALVLAAVLMARREHGSGRVATPEFAIKSLTAKTLYFNGAARPWLLKLRPDLLTTEDRDETSERARAMLQAVEDPKLFRRLDHEWHFDALLLVGDPSQYRPLLEHLLEAKDWALSYVDGTGMVLRRNPPQEWTLAALDALLPQFPEAKERASFYCQVAVRLLALRRGADAKICLERAQALDGKSAEFWNGNAIMKMNRGEWTAALSNVNRALAVDAQFLPALATKTQILYSTKKFSEAYDFSRRLLESYPNDPSLLFYHAKICHEAHATTDEIRTMRRLVEIADKAGRPASGYRLYLAQAYAKDGQAQPAIDEFNRILADAEISKEQRAFAQETMAQVKERSGLK